MWQIFWRFLHNWYVFSQKLKENTFKPIDCPTKPPPCKNRKKPDKKSVKGFFPTLPECCAALPSCSDSSESCCPDDHVNVSIFVHDQSIVASKLQQVFAETLQEVRYAQQHTWINYFFYQSSKSLSNSSQNRPIRTNFEVKLKMKE